jgi:hypothetical protein
MQRKWTVILLTVVFLLGGINLSLSGAAADQGVEADLQWTAHTPNIASAPWSLTWGDGKFVAVGDSYEDNETILTSEDGVNWETQYKGNTRINDIAWNGEKFVAVGFDGVALTSKNGIDWVEHSGPNTCEAIAWGTGKFVAVGIPNTIATSADGIEWIEHDTPNAYHLADIVYNGEKFVAVGTMGGVFTSVDGIEWEDHSMEERLSATCIAWGGDQFVVGSSWGFIYTSPDAVNWTKNDTWVGLVYDIVWGEDKYLALCGDAAGWGDIYVSSDGADWTLSYHIERPVFMAAAYGNSMFVAGDAFGNYHTAGKLSTTLKEETPLQPKKEVEPEPLTDIIIVVHGDTLETDVPPIIQSGRVLVPLRLIFEALGIDVGYDADTQMITGIKEDTEIVLWVNSDRALVNGVEKELDVPSLIIEGRTLVPVRFVAESTNQAVDWDGANRLVTIGE